MKTYSHLKTMDTENGLPDATERFTPAIDKRQGRKFLAPSVLVFLLTACAACIALAFGKEPYKPKIDPANFQSKIDHPYFPLVPGTVFHYIEKAGGETSENDVTVTHDTKTLMGVKCVVVHDVISLKGKVTEDTYDWYAQDKQGNVWYFGEATKEFKPGGAVDTAGSWEAGVNGQPGMIMPANPKPGEPYRQEYSPNNAEDMGQVIALGETVTVPAGTYTGCVKTKDWSLLEPGSENKWYAKGVGVVQSKSTLGEVATLISIKRP